MPRLAIGAVCILLLGAIDAEDALAQHTGTKESPNSQLPLADNRVSRPSLGSTNKGRLESRIKALPDTETEYILENLVSFLTSTTDNRLGSVVVPYRYRRPFQNTCVGSGTEYLLKYKSTGPAFTTETVKTLERSVAAIRFRRSEDQARIAKSKRWWHFDDAGQEWEVICTGTLIASDLLLTAAHCFWDKETAEQNRENRKLPSYQHNGNKKELRPTELAMLMEVSFDFKRLPGDQKKPFYTDHGVPFPITQLVEYGYSGPSDNNIDYAIVRLGKNKDGLLPGTLFTPRVPQSTSALPQSTPMAMIHHAEGNEKQVSVGVGRIDPNATLPNLFHRVSAERGASGAAIWDYRKRFVGIHTNGGCNTNVFGNENAGISVAALLKSSVTLRRLLAAPSPPVAFMRQAPIVPPHASDVLLRAEAPTAP